MTDAEMIAELRALRVDATAGDLNTAEIAKTDEWLDCPFCAGEGSVDGVTYINYDAAAVGVQFFGVGAQFVANEALYRALLPALPRLLALAEAGLRAEEMREALQELLPPEYGVSGGPFVGAKCIYEDGSDENTARHRGWISHEAVARARKAMEPSHG